MNPPVSPQSDETFGLSPLQIFEVTAVPISPGTVIEIPRGRPVRQPPSADSLSPLPAETPSIELPK